MCMRYAACLLLLPLAIAAASADAAGRCSLGRLAELPVTMEGLRPLITTQINGSDVRLLADSGAFYSMLSPGAAAELKLPRHAAPFGFYVRGIGGSTTPEVAVVEKFTFAGVQFHRAEFLVGGNELGSAVGMLGQNLLRVADVEYDLANGVIRLFKPKDCAEQILAYWAAGEPVEVVELDRTSGIQPQTIGKALVNNVEIRVLFDTGAATSILSVRAAKRAGLTPSSPGVTPAGATYGIGQGSVRIWNAPIASFKIGGEEVKSTRLLIGDLNLSIADMLIGDDFFLSHRIYVANGQRKLYFTYNGGSVFVLKPPDQTPATAPPAAPAPMGNAPSATAGTPKAGGHPAAIQTQAEARSASTEWADEPTDAAGFMRRGTAFAARRDFGHALADLTRACELAPGQADYFYERGRVRRIAEQRELAMQDFDRALELKPEHVAARFARAQLQQAMHADAASDLDALDRLVPPQDDLRLPLGVLYDAGREHVAAVHQYDLWIEAHGHDVRLAAALNDRCWARAAANRDLDRALEDCNRALRLRPKAAVILDSRGFVYLRRGEVDRSIKDYDAALALRPKEATSLYGRGLAELRKGLREAGQADLAEARARDSHIDGQFAGLGLTP